MKKVTLAAASALCVALAVAGCSAGAGDSPDAEAPGTEAPDVVGEWGNPAADDEPSLNFDAEGNVGGTDGCNSLTGTYEQSGSEIVFGDVIQTLMFCEDVDDWLSQMNSAEIAGDTLTFFDESDAEIGTLSRAG